MTKGGFAPFLLRLAARLQPARTAHLPTAGVLAWEVCGPSCRSLHRVTIWLLAEIDPDDHDHAFGLCDLGLGEPELDWISLQELATVRGRFGLLIERDLHFRAEKRLSVHARDARRVGQIVV